MDKPAIFYKRRSYVLFVILILMIIYFIKTDIISIDRHNSQRDTISLQDLTIKELNYKILDAYGELDLKKQEIVILNNNIETLKKAVREKRNYNDINIIDVKSISMDSAGNVIKIGE